MLMTYSEAKEKAGGRYALAKSIESGNMRRLSHNLYATGENDGMLAALGKLYPEAIATGQTALYLHGLIDSPPELFDLATKRGGTKIRNEVIRQTFIPEGWLRLGVTTLSHDGADVRAYDLERMLLELMRSRNKLPYDVYKEAIGSYRRIADRLDVYRLEEYAHAMPCGKAHLRRVLEEVF